MVRGRVHLTVRQRQQAVRVWAMRLEAPEGPSSLACSTPLAWPACGGLESILTVGSGAGAGAV